MTDRRDFLKLASHLNFPIDRDFFNRYEQLKEDKADVVDYLKRTLQQRLDQILELQAR